MFYAFNPYCNNITPLRKFNFAAGKPFCVNKGLAYSTTTNNYFKQP